jgi:hypothetical protein
VQTGENAVDAREAGGPLTIVALDEIIRTDHGS